MSSQLKPCCVCKSRESNALIENGKGFCAICLADCLHLSVYLNSKLNSKNTFDLIIDFYQNYNSKY